MRKPTFCKCLNEGTDQLHGNHVADQRLCFCYIDIVQFIYFLNPKLQPLTIICGSTAGFELDLVGNSEEGFPCDEAHTIIILNFMTDKPEQKTKKS